MENRPDLAGNGLLWKMPVPASLSPHAYGLCATVPKTLGAPEVYWSDGLTVLLQVEPTGYGCPMSLA